MRLASIDILRALTMVLMIWVNDFWTLEEVPKWLRHATSNESYLGFSDIIFPLFLFIMGLSTPYAIRNRLAKNESRASITKHIFIRSFSLLLIGFFTVNYETAHHKSIGIGKYFWCILMTLAVFFIWTNWKRSPVSQKWHPYLRSLGFSILIYLALVYHGGISGENWMKTQWWGILGLIGWAYMVNSLVFLYTNGRLYAMIILWLILNALSIVHQIGTSFSTNSFLDLFSTISSGTVPAFTCAGIVGSLLFKKLSKTHIKLRYLGIISLGIINIGYGMITVSYWGISKIRATPSWLAICTGIGFLVFTIVYYIADQRKVTGWSKIIAPAGTATLTCYMIPYIIYPMQNIIGLNFPAFINTGNLGLLVSFGFSLTVVIFAGWLEKRGFKLKL